MHIFNENPDNSAVPWFFRLGFMYYSLLGTLLVFFVGYPISIYTGGQKILDDRLLAPIVRRMYNSKISKLKESESTATALQPLNVKLEHFEHIDNKK